MADEGFLSRWSRLKSNARSDEPAAGSAVSPSRTAQPDSLPPAAPVGEPACPTLEEAMKLDGSSDFSAFVAQGTDASVRRLALRKLFADPHFNRMDGLDVYIGDYTRADPIAPAMLASLRRAAGLLRDDEPEGTSTGEQHAVRAAACAPPTRENDEY